ncbi:MAG: transposase [Chloroflexi bacterium]|nr:transposase [Chloroflexota bacterium]
MEKEHWTGRRGYSIRGLWSAPIAGVVRQCHSSAKVAWLLQRDKDVRTVCGFSKDDLPGDDALGRFLRKLVAHEQLLEECFTGLVKRLQELLPGFGAKLAGDSTDIKAYSNGHKKNPSDADGRWGAKGAGHHAGQKGKEKDLYWWFGYKLHLVVDALYEPPATPLY